MFDSWPQAINQTFTKLVEGKNLPNSGLFKEISSKKQSLVHPWENGFEIKNQDAN